AELDVRAGADMGRIYRIVPENTAARKVPQLDGLPVNNLILKLYDQNGVVRDLAQRLLIERKDATGTEARAMVSYDEPRGFVHALHTLRAQGRLSLSIANNALAARHPIVRRHGIQLLEQFLEKNSDFDEMFLKLADHLVGDADAGVRIQLALTLG